MDVPRHGARFRRTPVARLDPYPPVHPRAPRPAGCEASCPALQSRTGTQPLRTRLSSSTPGLSRDLVDTRLGAGGSPGFGHGNCHPCRLGVRRPLLRETMTIPLNELFRLLDTKWRASSMPRPHGRAVVDANSCAMSRRPQRPLGHAVRARRRRAFIHPVQRNLDLACFSFYLSKNLGAYGEGGMPPSHRESRRAQPGRAPCRDGFREARSAYWRS